MTTIAADRLIGVILLTYAALSVLLVAACYRWGQRPHAADPDPTVEQDFDVWEAGR